MGQLKKVLKQGTAPNLAVHLTPRQREFVYYLVHQADSPTVAARKAGYAQAKMSAYTMTRLPHIQIAIRQERSRYFEADLANVAAGTLRQIMLDDEAPAAARVSAARTVLEVTREIGRRQDDPADDRPLSEMTPDELADLIEQWKGERAAMAVNLDPGDVEVVNRTQDMAQLSPQAASIDD
jgi:phage terminase small subunit